MREASDSDGMGLNEGGVSRESSAATSRAADDACPEL